MGKIFWNGLKVLGYIISAIFGFNLIYCMLIFGVRHEGWFFIYNPTFTLFGIYHSNSDLAWQILSSTVILLVAVGLLSLSNKKLTK